MKRTAENIVVMETDKGSNVTIIFQKEDNPDIEDIVTNNLLMSYEKRMKKINDDGA
jgi:mevalonate pyrophosphate decarboxylase